MWLPKNDQSNAAYGRIVFGQESMHGINIVRTGIPVSLEECNFWFDRDAGGKFCIGSKERGHSYTCM
jgi:hypothetical protein